MKDRWSLSTISADVITYTAGDIITIPEISEIDRLTVSTASITVEILIVSVREIFSVSDVENDTNTDAVSERLIPRISLPTTSTGPPPITMSDDSEILIARASLYITTTEMDDVSVRLTDKVSLDDEDIATELASEIETFSVSVGEILTRTDVVSVRLTSNASFGLELIWADEDSDNDTPILSVRERDTRT